MQNREEADPNTRRVLNTEMTIHHDWQKVAISDNSKLLFGLIFRKHSGTTTIATENVNYFGSSMVKMVVIVWF